MINIDALNDDEKLAALESIHKSIAESKEIQKKKITTNVELIVKALKKIESDLKQRYDETGQLIANLKNGEDGRDGKDGKDGKNGRDGRDGPVGPRGYDGVPGRNGIDGTDGVSVTDAHIDFDGSLIISLSSGRVINVGEVVAADIAEKIKVITNGGGTSQSVLDAIASLQAQISAIVSGLSYKGTWNASTNVPTLTSSVGTAGFYYIVSVAGSTNLNGITDWQVGDWAVFSGTVWQKLDQTNLVTSVAGRTGAVVLSNTDISGLGTMSTQAANNVSITGGSITGITDLAIADGGTGASTAANARTNLGLVIGTDVLSPTGSAASLTSFPTFNQNTTGTAANVTGTVAIANGGTGATTAGAARTALGATTVGANVFTLTNPSAITFPRFNADNTVSALDAATFRTAIGAGTSSTTGTVTSVAASVPTFLSIGGSPITSSGTLAITLSGTALPTTSGGTGLTSFTANGVVYASSTSALATGSALTFDGTTLGTLGLTVSTNRAQFKGNTSTGFTGGSVEIGYTGTVGIVNAYDRTASAYKNLEIYGNDIYNYVKGSNAIWDIAGVGETMRLTSTGLGIGTSSPAYKLTVEGTLVAKRASVNQYIGMSTTSGEGFLDTINTLSTDYIPYYFRQTNNAGTVTRMSLDVSGNLGVGTTSPVGKLDVAKTSNDTISRTNASGVFGDYVSLGAGLLMQQTLSSPYGFALQAANAANSVQFPLLLNPSGGNVGIGTSSPTQKLTVAGAINLSADATNPNTGVAFWSQAGIGATLSGFNIAFNTGSNGAQSERMRVTSAGDVGIGTSSPVYKLDVRGTGYFSTASGTNQLTLGDSTNGTISAFATSNSNLIFYANGSSESMRVNSTGLGIGTSSPSTKLQVAKDSALTSTWDAAQLWLTGATSTAYRLQLGYDTTNNYGVIQAIQGGVAFTNLLLNPLGGNVGIGTTSPSNKLVVSNAGAQGFEFDPANGIMQVYNRSTSAYGELRPYGSLIRFFTGTSPTERARIDSSGNLLLGTTSSSPAGTVAQFVNSWSGGAKWGISLDQTVSSATQYTHINFSTNGTTVGYINANNSITTYNSVSDYRLKTIIGSVSGSGERIDALEPIEYEWKTDGSRTRGFLAHKFQEVYANSVSGTKDAVDEQGNPIYQAMQAGSAEVIADLVAEIQSLRKRLADAGI